MGSDAIELAASRPIDQLDRLVAAMNEVADLVDSPELDDPELMLLWKQLDVVRTDLGAIRKMLEVRIAGRLTTWKWHVQEGVGVFRARPARPRKTWLHRRAMTTWLNKAHDDGRLNQAADVVDVLLEAAAISYWRVGVLTEAGLDPDELGLRVVEQARDDEFEIEIR